MNDDPFTARMQDAFPGREVCFRCLMTFRKVKAMKHAEGPLRCPNCRRKFWVGQQGNACACYTAGHEA